jgi:hypothetical protein
MPARPAWLPLVGALAAAALLSGCATPAAEPSGAAPTSAQQSGTAAPEPQRTVEAEAASRIDTADWLEHVTADGSIAFRYPADWALDADSEWFTPSADRGDVADPYERWMDSATLTAPNGQQLVRMADFVDVGWACGGVAEPLEVLATEPAPGRGLTDDEGLVIATVALGTLDDRWRFGVGITGPAWLDASEGCAVGFVFASSDGGASMGTHLQLTSTGDDPLWTVDSLDEARAYMETQEYATIVEVLRSVVTA